MSLARKAVRAAAWTIIGSTSARAVTVVGTLLLTYLLAPAVVGEVSVATVLVTSANQFSSFGFGQYIVTHPNLTPGQVFQVSTVHLGFGLVAIVGVLALTGPLGSAFGSPHLVAYMPGLAASVLISRLSIIPERVLVREMKFAQISVARALGEVTYAGSAVALAYAGWGGQAIVLGNVARAILRTGLVVAMADRRAWLVPERLDRALVRDVFRFGTPLWLAASAAFFSLKWDNLVMAGAFGPSVVGLYNLGYNLADIPTSQVGEQIGDVLLPSFTRLDHDGQRRALVRATSLLALIVFPLAIGLGVVAGPLCAALMPVRWHGVAAYLAILSSLSVVRPVSWVILSYLQAQHRTRPVMVLEIGKLAALLLLIAGLAVFGPHVASVGVGIAFGLHALGSMWLIERTDGVKLGRLVEAMAGPLAACLIMVAAVLALRWGLRDGLGLGRRHPGRELTLEVAAGALVYAGACFVVARQTTLDLLALLRQSFRRRRGAGAG